jgi:transcriptional regulator with XRE-family HTH domain
MTDDTALLKRIGLTVRLERTARGLSLADLATAARISRVTLESIERGSSGEHRGVLQAGEATGLSLDRVLEGQSDTARTLLGDAVPSTGADSLTRPRHGQGSQERDNDHDDGEEAVST